MVRSMWLCVVLMGAAAVSIWGQEAPAVPAPPSQTAPDSRAAPVVRRPARAPRVRPNPDADGTYHLGDGVTAPVVVHVVDPEFTDKARRAKVNGDCQISLVVDRDGRPQEVKVVRSVAEAVPPNERDAAMSLDAKAVEAVEGYRFKPAMFGGKPVPFELQVGVTFRIF